TVQGVGSSLKTPTNHSRSQSQLEPRLGGCDHPFAALLDSGMNHTGDSSILADQQKMAILMPATH
ncbi:MAG TPA: hypothetical protein V6C65_18025, partial [Allocoleopsis sp.]